MKKSEMYRCEASVVGGEKWEVWRGTMGEATAKVNSWLASGIRHLTRAGVLQIIAPSQIKTIRIVPPRKTR